MQLFVSDCGFMFVYPMKSKSEIPEAIKAFAKEIGVPTALILDPEGTQRSKLIDKITKEMGCKLKFLEKQTQWANLAELYIGLMKKAVLRDMKEKDSPLIFWDYCAERRAKINNLTAKRNLLQLQGSNAQQRITGFAGDISHLCQFGWFEWVYFKDPEQFPLQTEKLGRCLGPADNYSNEMSQWILKDTMKITASHTVRQLKEEEYRDPAIIRQREEFMQKCQRTHGDKLKVGNDEVKVESNKDNQMESDDSGEEVPPFIPLVPDAEPSKIPEQDVVDEDGNPVDKLDHIYETYINMEVKMPRQSKDMYGQVIRMCLDENGKTIGTPHENPMLNTLMYEVKFEDDTVQAYAANTIAENMWRSVNDEGHHEDSLHAILDHKFDKTAVKDGYVYDRQGRN